MSAIERMPELSQIPGSDERVPFEAAAAEPQKDDGRTSNRKSLD